MMYRQRLQRLSGSLVMSTFMSAALSGVFSLLEFGLSIQWLQVWGQSILIALPIAFSLDMVFGDKLRFLSGKLADKAASVWP
ncbi:DUF2798 domain-containing protein [Mameliella alba]|uniref:DUF2798 domain-containing protein n=2 Tax=Roseobacteraceae TaxID=2854170 RepID=UPI000B5387DE|nr:DUF2798 domain-containing protein [Mameliella alba]MBY6119681.1 DUF2798 domain-containing protein [Mameliella alba]OWV45582.1 hypothetical protein CDZ95_01045 [Mameliella alba]OWV65673.1 hypothetical protein CDZ97_07305 [Mameliella alba]